MRWPLVRRKVLDAVCDVLVELEEENERILEWARRLLEDVGRDPAMLDAARARYRERRPIRGEENGMGTVKTRWP